MDMFTVIAEGVADEDGAITITAGEIPPESEQYEALRVEFLTHAANCESQAYYAAAEVARAEAETCAAKAAEARHREAAA